MLEHYYFIAWFKREKCLGNGVDIIWTKVTWNHIDQGNWEQLRTDKKDGLKKAENEKERKKLKDVVKMLLDMEIKPKEKEHLLSKYNLLEPNDLCIRTLIIDKLMEKALNGDIKACTLIFELSGETPNENDPGEVKLPIFNIEVVDNSHLKKVFEEYEENVH